MLCCYEAGRDGFWLHRFPQAHGVQNDVVDSSEKLMQDFAHRVGDMLALIADALDFRDFQQ